MFSNKDLEIFKIESESNDHIVLKHIDIDNGYKLIISISKFYPEKYGNYIFYNLSYYDYIPSDENSFNLNKRSCWCDEIANEVIGFGNSPIELQIQDNIFNYKRDLFNITKNLLLIHPSLINIKQVYIKSIVNMFKEIYNYKSKNEYLLNNNNYCNKNICKTLMNAANFKNTLNKENRFIINNNLFDIEPLFLYKLSLYKLREKENLNEYINSDINFIDNRVDKIIIIRRFLINIVKEIPKIYSEVNLEFNKDNKLIFFNFLSNKDKNKIDNVFNVDKLYNIPIIFFYDYFIEDFNTKINNNKRNRDKLFNKYLKNDKSNLISTFCFIYNLDDTNKFKLFLVHFNHITGKIDNFLDFNSFESNSDFKYKNINNLKLLSVIFKELESRHKNLIDVKSNKFVKLREIVPDKNEELLNVQLSITILNNNKDKVKKTLNIYKLIKKNIKDFNYISYYLNVNFSLFDFNNKNISYFLKDFLFVYRNKNNKNVKIKEIIINYNKLVQSRNRNLNKNKSKL